LLVRVGMRVSVNVNVGVMVMVRMRVMVSVTVRVRLHACPCLLFPWGPERSRSLETRHRERGMRSPRGDGRGPFRLSNHLRCAAIALVQAVRSFVQRSRQLQTGRQGSPECKMPDIRAAAARHRTPEPDSIGLRLCDAVHTRPESFSSAIFRSRSPVRTGKSSKLVSGLEYNSLTGARVRNPLPVRVKCIARIVMLHRDNDADSSPVSTG
jgi:hypothetical protein